MTRKAASLSTGGLDDPKFGELLHAASYSQDEQESSETWSPEIPSTSETDDDDDQDGYAEDDDEDSELNQSAEGKLCSFLDCTNAARSRGLCPAHGGGTRCRTEGCKKHVVSDGLCVAHGGGRRCRDSSGCSSSAVGGAVLTEEVDAAKCPSVPAVPKAEAFATFTAEEDGVSDQAAGLAPRKVDSALRMAEDIDVKCPAALAVLSAVHAVELMEVVADVQLTAAAAARRLADVALHTVAASGARSEAARAALNDSDSARLTVADVGCTTTARKGGFCFAHGGRSTASTASSRSKMASPPDAFALAPVTGRSKQMPRPEMRSPIPALTLPPRRLLPPINTMLRANHPSILRRYQPIPPIRRPVATFERAEREASCTQNLFDEEWPDTFNPHPAWQHGPLDNRQQPQILTPRFQDQVPRTPTASSSRPGYSWQRLQETIRRESRVHGLTNDEDESAYEDKPTFKSENHEEQNDAVPMAGGGFYWTRSRGPIRS
ncbi:hypothetical protein PR003_g16669 [Phytophthora rubi]|uniref:WRKY19-like zinc finger domain-containing protein n=1 Tax=Phytophthora rubi TaxID=129364 RepID=A0A6A4EIN9_9STRA|nr:hypothetical protein PR003_g16669 [Phytophthora rubi]